MAGTIVKNIRRGNTRYVEISFTSAIVGEEIAIPNLPDRITITRLTAKRVSGTGVTVNPAVGRTSGFSAGDFDELGSDIDGAPADRVSTVAPNELELGTNDLFVQPRPDAGTNNVIQMELHIQDGWIR